MNFKEYIKENQEFTAAIGRAYQESDKTRKGFIQKIKEKTGLTDRGIKRNQIVQDALESYVLKK